MAEAGRNLRINPFMVDEDHLATGEKWDEWLEELEREMRFFRISEAVDKKDAMLIYGGAEIRRLEKSLQDPREGDVYTKLKDKLTDYFSPKKNVHYARYLFLKMRPLPGENTVSYAARLREKSVNCSFPDTDDRILEQIIQTTDNAELVRKALHKKWSLEQTLTEMQVLEDTSMQIDAMGRQDSSNISKVSRKTKKRTQDKYQNKELTKDKTKTCKYCGRTHPMQKELCPAYGKICSKCKKPNHFATVCLSSRQPRKKSMQDVKRATNESDTDDTSDGDLDIDFIEESVRHLTVGKVKVNRVSDYEKTIPIVINDVIVRVEPDSGADVNVMDEHQYMALRRKSYDNLCLQVSDTKLNTLQNELQVSGEFKATARNQTRGTETTFVVVKGRINSPPLLGRRALLELGMMEIRPDGSLKEANELRRRDSEAIKSVKDNKAKSEIDKILSKYDELFQGIGKIFDKKNNEEFLVKFSMKADATPVAQKPRPVPYYLQEPLREWLDQCIKDEIFEKVQPGEPVTWCSPLVVQPKPRYANVDKEHLDPHMIRASVDLRVPNKFMERNRILQAPIIEDFTCKFHQCEVFSKMDLKQGYHQLILHPESRTIATFSTPWGNMRPKRLIFGAKSSQDLFDEAMFRIFGDIPNCLNQRDDILIGGVNIADHNKTLETVLQRAKDFGITLNKEKCQFGVAELDFYGYRFTSEGLKPTEEKVRAVKECSPPESKEEVRSFLGMIGYLSKFIPRYAVLTAPLRRLTGQDVLFTWGPEEKAAFQKLKDSITSDDTMAFFNPRKPIIVRTEASFNEGLSAGLFQRTNKGLQPVHYISRSMTPAEKRYSQTEKDALAVKWAKSRLGMYLLGAPKFKIITSHKPLIPMFNRACAKLPPRIEKWIMEMQDVDFELIYEPGRDAADPMDYLSRHPLPETDKDDTEKTINIIINNEHGVVIKSIKEATANDNVLQEVLRIMKQNKWEKHKNRPEIRPYFQVRHELYRAEGLLLRCRQIVIPEKLQKHVISAAHSMGHFGMTRTKQMLRAKYWFPRLNGMVENVISKCYQCQISTVEHKQEPVKPSEIPATAWHTVSVDFGGPYPDGHYNLLVIDKRTRFPVVEQTTSTSCRITCDRLRKIFATHGIPERLESDNGPPFNSGDFSQFAEEMGFKHHRVTPEHPRANGEAESFMKVLNKTEQIAHSEGRSSSTAIQYMLMGYRSTPHPATGYSPYEALMRRAVRTKLDYKTFERDTDYQKMDHAITEHDKEYKKKWVSQHRHPKCKKQNFRLGDKVLLKKKKVNKWSMAHEREHYKIIGIHGSTIEAKRMSDGRITRRDASKFKLIQEPRGDTWREMLLRSPDRSKPDNFNNTEGRMHEERNEQRQENVPDDSIHQEENQLQETESIHEDNQQEEPKRRELPRRNRRLPSKFKDYILDFKKR